ncbi:MAG: outer membrane lipoprotein LolB [Pseudomonadales bacterium]|nr:outer membrane lipoprotein LolB [Pseudomonadales bacterium]
MNHGRVARRGHRAALIGLCALLALAGCAQQPRRAQLPADWQAHAAAVAARAEWQLQGKIGVRAASGSGSAFLTWKQQAGNYRLVLSGALGMGKLVLTGDADGVAWNDSRGRAGRHADPDALVAEIWGWQLPVAALEYWIRGIPQPDLPVEDAEFAGADVTRFRQSGWVVEPGAYREVDGLALPTRLRLEGEGAVLTVLINRWGPPAP